MPDLRYTKLGFGDLPGWAEDDHDQAIRTYAMSWDRTRKGWPKPGVGLTWIERRFTPVLIEDGTATLFTGYFEPEIFGSRVRTLDFPTPLYRLPPSDCVLTRKEIETTGALAGSELLWVASPVEAFFLQVQGSGRVCLTDGATVRIGFAGRNGHTYRSVGQAMIDQGLADASNMSAKVIRDWVARRGAKGQELLWMNPSFVFFQEMDSASLNDGPIGAMGCPVTPLRTLAVDPAITPLGAMVWIDRAAATPFRRLMVAQDTGSAIRGAQRADIFFGTGAAAGAAAGSVKDGGQMSVLLPNAMADML